jgi:phospholipid transport system substrate-binding protein
MSPRIRPFFIVLALALAPAAIAAAQTGPAPAATAPAPLTPAEQSVKRLQESLLGVMQKAGALGFAGRRDALAPVLAETFDFAGMVRFAVSGAIWATLPPTQQQRLTEAFAAMSIATYAERFNGYADEKFVIAERQDAPRGAVIVKTRIEQVNQPPVLLNYVLRENNGQWRIFDVVFEGKYSEMATRREEYTAIIKREGVDALIAYLERAARESAARG